VKNRVNTLEIHYGMLTALGAFNCWSNCYCWVKRNGGRMIVKGAQGAELLGFNKSPGNIGNEI